MVTELRPPRPRWLKAKFPGGQRFNRLKNLMRQHELHTVCEEAQCPNIGECWNAGTATFMILGDTCTRACGFCAVTSGRPNAVDILEPLRLARAIETLCLDYAVITSVNRDDLTDGGASIFAACIRAIRKHTPQCKVEVLIPDFLGNWGALATVLDAGPIVLNHNTETVPRLYPRARPKARYLRSLQLLTRVKELAPPMTTKSSLMVGLGESLDELKNTIFDICETGCDLLTVGQYLQPTKKHLPVDRFYHPEEFEEIRHFALQLGYRHVEAGPLVRSSYHAAEQSKTALTT